MKTIAISLAFAALSAGTAFAGAKEGKAVYNTSCKSCHGADGTANPVIVKMLKVDIPDLKSPAVQPKTDAELKKVARQKNLWVSSGSGSLPSE